MPQSELQQSDPSIFEPAIEPIPPRYWWLKRIALVGGILVVALFALRLWWGWEANRRLQAEIDKIIAAGEPIYPEDFDPKEEIPDDQNAARLLIGADEVINLTSEQQEVFEKVIGKSDLIRAQLDEVREIVENNAEVFRRLRRARGLSRTDWGMRFRTPALNTSIPPFSGQRRLSKFMYLSAMYHNIVGDNGEAVEIVRDGIAHSQNLSRQQTLIAQLTAWACEGLTIHVIENTLPALSITPKNEVSAQGGRAATHAQVHNLIAELMDERGVREGMRRAMMCERMYQVDIHKEIVRGASTISAMFGWGGGPSSPAADFAWRHLLRPAVTLDIVGSLRETTPLVDAVDATSISDVATLEYISTDEWVFQFLLHPVRNQLRTFDRVFEIYFRALATRRLAGTAMAIRLYEVDHGRRPEMLSELVPEYLLQIPDDPFAENGQTLRYHPHATHPVVYSVGENRVDDGGKPRGRRRTGDVPFFLDGWRAEDEDEKASPSSTEASDDQKNAEQDEGEADEDKTSEEEP